jgi:methyl-accepting chemotaxis protein
MISDIISSLEAMYQMLRRGRAINVNDQSAKNQAIALAQQYFSRARPIIAGAVVDPESLRDHDELWQQLVRLAHGNNARKSYTKTIARLRKQLAEFNVHALTSGVINTQQSESQTQISREEDLVVKTLERLLPSAAASYRQALNDLKQPDRLSYRGTANEFREALRETIDHLAPDAQVIKQDGFKFEDDKRKPTTKQKVRYLLSSRGRNKTQRETVEKFTILVEELTGEVSRAVYNHASLASHVQQSKNEVQKLKRYLDTVLFDLLEISVEHLALKNE